MKHTPKTNVYNIGTGRPLPLKPAANEDKPRNTAPDESRVDAPKSRAVTFLRHVLAMILMWLRGPLRFLSGLIAFPTMIALPVIALGMDSSTQKTTWLLALVALSFGLFCIRWLYDSLIMWVSPEPLILNS